MRAASAGVVQDGNGIEQGSEQQNLSGARRNAQRRSGQQDREAASECRPEALPRPSRHRVRAAPGAGCLEEEPVEQAEAAIRA